MKLLGYEKSTFNFVNKLHLDCHANSRILDVGCGTGVVGLSLMSKFPQSTLLATDTHKKLLHQVTANAKKYGLDVSRISLGLSDITLPDKVTLTHDSLSLLQPNHFDIVSASSVIGYSKNQERTIKKLLSLIKPGGYFINMEMNEHLLGRWISHGYHYPMMPLLNMTKIIESERFHVESIPLTMRCFPTNITRICFIAQKQ